MRLQRMQLRRKHWLLVIALVTAVVLPAVASGRPAATSHPGTTAQARLSAGRAAARPERRRHRKSVGPTAPASGNGTPQAAMNAFLDYSRPAQYGVHDTPNIL